MNGEAAGAGLNGRQFHRADGIHGLHRLGGLRVPVPQEVRDHASRHIHCEIGRAVGIGRDHQRIDRVAVHTRRKADRRRPAGYDNVASGKAVNRFTEREGVSHIPGCRSRGVVRDPDARRGCFSSSAPAPAAATAPCKCTSHSTRDAGTGHAKSDGPRMISDPSPKGGFTYGGFARLGRANHPTFASLRIGIARHRRRLSKGLGRFIGVEKGGGVLAVKVFNDGKRLVIDLHFEVLAATLDDH